MHLAQQLRLPHSISKCLGLSSAPTQLPLGHCRWCMNPWVPATTWKTQDEFCALGFRIAQCCFSNKSYFLKKGIYRSNLFLPFKWIKSFFLKKILFIPPNSFQPVKISFNTQPLQIRDFFSLHLDHCSARMTKQLLQVMEEWKWKATWSCLNPLSWSEQDPEF